MNIFIYSDESGVFDQIHHENFVFGGLMFFSKDERDIWSRKYISAEKAIRMSNHVSKDKEIKATTINNKAKSKLYRSLNKTEKFGIIIRQKKLSDRIFDSKKSKQSYLDWAYKMAVKNKFLELHKKGLINLDEIENLYFFVDEHTTATNGLYELRESLEQEFKYGTFNYKWTTFHPPIFKNLKIVEVKYCDSSTKTLVRAADIVANHIYHLANENSNAFETTNNLNVIYHP